MSIRQKLRPLQNFDNITSYFCGKKYGMIRLFVFLAILVSALPVSGQQTRTLEYYLRAARENSPLINDIRNREKISRYQLERLRAAYMRSRLELGGDLLFVPVVSFEGGRAAFRWNDRDGTDYAGYDLGESSGHLHAGVTWTQPLLGRGRYKAEETQAGIQSEILDNDIRMEEHQLDLFVDGGLPVGDLSRFYRHFGVSAGLSFRLVLFDGRQKCFSLA